MQFDILGPLEVRVEGRLVDIGGRKQRAVLAVLLIDVNRVVSLDRLIDQLWGDEPPARATSTLQAYVSNLRKALEPDRPPRTPAQVLASQPPGYVLRADPESVDAVRFERMTTEAGQLAAAGDPEAARARLVEALALWRGPALADFAFEPFAQAEAARLEDLRLTAQEDLVDAGLALGQHAAVVAEIERLVAEHPVRERLWFLLMLALYRTGRQAEALRAFGEARRLLADELGVTPGPDLQRLETDILNQSPDLDWRAPQAPPAPIPAFSGPITAPERANGPKNDLVGRDDQLERLDSLLEEAAAGRTRVVLVTGEAGIGKTRLLEALVDRAAARGFRSAWGRCLDDRGAPAFWPWSQILRDLLAAWPGDRLRAALGGRAAELAQFVPEVKELVPDAGQVAVVHPEAARFRLYDAVTGFLKRLAADEPLLLVIDDLHSADTASVRLLEFLSSELRDARVLLAATYRDSEVTADHPLAEALATLARQPVTERLPLAGLGPGDVADYIAGAIEADVPAELAQAVHRRTDGNPFFVAELVRLLASEGRLDEGAGDTPVPAGVRDVIRQRIGRLPQDAQAFLTVAAVVGRHFAIDLVAEVASIEEERAFDLVETALVTGVVVEVPGVLGEYQFAHGLVQETLYGGLTAVRRTRLHGAVGRALDGRGADRSAAMAAVMARHWTGAGDRPRALAATVRAAAAAAGSGAHEDAADHYERAVAMWADVPDPAGAAGLDHVALLHAAAAESFHAGRERRAVELVTVALAEPGLAADPERTAVLRERRGHYAWVAGDTAAAFGDYQEAVELLRDVPASPAKARVLASQAQAYMLRAHYRDAIATSRLAIEAATEAGARAEEGHARNTLGASLATQGRLDEGIAELEAARHIAVELGRPDDECRALSNIASRLAQGSQLTEALNWARTGIDVSRRHGMVGFYGAYIAATAALCLIRLGRLDEADAISAEMLSGRLSTVSAVELRLGRITMLIRRGDLAEARALLDETAAMVAEVESVNFWGQLWIARAELAMAEDRSDAVLAAVKEGLALVATTDEESCGPELCWLAARVAADAGDAAAASEWLAELERFLDRPRTRGVEPLPDAKGFCLLALAEVARAADDPAAADRWEAAAEHWASTGQRHQSAYAQSRF